MNNFTPEIELLILCARTEFDSKEIKRIKVLLNQDINWQDLIKIASKNKMLSLLYWNLNSVCPELIPEVHLNFLKNHFYENSKSNLYLTKELYRITSLLEEQKISVIPYKGPMLTSLLYENLALREFSDLDILIKKENVIEAKKLLVKEGYEPVYKLTSSMETLLLEHNYAYEFDNDDGVHLEVHWGIVPPYFLSSIGSDYFWEDLREVPEKLLLILCLHASKDCWESLSQICDLSELIIKGDINWELVIKQASILGCRRILFLGLFLVNDLLGTKIPDEILKKVQADNLIMELAHKVYKNIFSNVIEKRSITEVMNFQLKLKDNLSGKINYIFKFTFMPTIGDLLFMPFPGFFSFLYYFIRPFRLMEKYSFNLDSWKTIDKKKIKSKLPECELLLLCARSKVSPQKAERIKEIIKKGISWESLITTARANKVTPLLYWNLTSICPELIPGEYLNFLKNHFYATSKNNLYLTKELCTILDLLEKNKIFVIPFKGPVLASFLYNNLALREFSDLDFLVKRNDVLKIKELLLKEGYKIAQEMPLGAEDTYIKNNYSYCFARKDGVELEFCWRLAPSYFLPAVSTEDIVSSGFEKVYFSGRAIPALSPEELLIALSINGTKRSWESLSFICDIAELINSKKEMDWNWILKQAEKLHCRRMVFVGLFLASNFLDVKLPDTILKKINNDSAIGKLAGKIYDDSMNGSTDLDEMSYFQFSVRDNFLDKVRYIFNFALTKNVEDLYFAKLPKSLSFVYRIIWPIRLVAKYTFGLYGGKKLSGFVPTPYEVISSMFELGNITSEDVIYDIGCGDGRILIEAAKSFGAKGVGIEIDSKLIKEAKLNAKENGVDNLVTFIQKDAMEVNLSDASIVMFYLSISQSTKFKLKLQQELRNSAKIISHCSYIEDWEPFKTKIVSDKAGYIHSVSLWLIEDETKVSSRGLKEELLNV